MEQQDEKNQECLSLTNNYDQQDEKIDEGNSQRNNYVQQQDINSENTQHSINFKREQIQLNKQEDQNEQLKKKKIDEIFKIIKIKDSYSSAKYDIYNELLKKNYFLERYSQSVDFGDYFEGYFQNEKGFKEECIFLILQNISCEDQENEIRIWKTFNQPINILKLKDTFQIHQLNILVFEKYQYTLFQELKQFQQRKIVFSLNKLLQIIFDLIFGLIEFKIYNIIHLDIKSSNIILSKEGGYCYANFYSSFNLKKNQETVIQYCSPYFASPEVLSSEKDIDYSSDVYSLGKTLKSVLDMFKRIHQDYLNNKETIREIINNFQQIIQQNMIQKNRNDRSKCHSLIELFLQPLQRQEIYELLLSLQSKLNKMICLNQYDENKEKHYGLQVKLLFSLISLKLIQNNQNLLNNSINYNIENQQYYQEVEQNGCLGLSKQKKTIQGVIECLNDVGLYYKDVGENKKGVQYLLKSLEIKKQKLNEINLDNTDSIKTELINQFLEENQFCSEQEQQILNTSAATVENAISQIRNHNQNKKCLKCQQQQDEISKQMVENDLIEISGCLNNIGLCFMNVGEYERSLKYLEESLGIRQQIFITNHPAIVESLINVGLCYQRLGKKYKQKSEEMKKQMQEDNLNKNNNNK